MADIVKLRGHHLLCMLTYIGKGYTPAFTDNYDAIIDRVNRGAAIEITTGPDAICAALRPGGVASCAHATICRRDTVRRRDRIALKDIARLLQMPIPRPGTRLHWNRRAIGILRHYFARGASRRACLGCSWHGLCSDIAKGGFTGVKLSP